MKLNRVYYILGMSLISFFVSESIFAACRLRITNISSAINFSANQNPGAQNFRIRKRNPGENCQFFVGVSKGYSTNYDRKLYRSGGALINYNLRKNSGLSSPVLKNFPDATNSDEVISGYFSPGHPRSLNFVYYPSSESWSIYNNLKFGTYTDNVVFSVYESSFPPSSTSLLPDHSKNVTYTYTIPKVGIMSLLNVGQPFSEPTVTTKNLNFGNMTTGMTLSFDLVLIYNAGYAVTFQSQFGQKLKHTSLNTFVPYSINISGIGTPPTLTAGTPINVMSGAGVSPNAPVGDRKTIQFTLGNTSNAFAGNYSDSILITMSTIE